MRSTQVQLAPIRNIALLGQSGSGKSTLIEALLTQANAIVEHDEYNIINNTAQEQQAGHSLETWLFHAHDDAHINFVDTPGTPELFGRAVAVLPAVESVALVINACHGVELVSRKAFELMQASNKGGLIVITQCDATDARVAVCPSICPRQITQRWSIVILNRVTAQTLPSIQSVRPMSVWLNRSSRWTMS